MSLDFGSVPTGSGRAESPVTALSPRRVCVGAPLPDLGSTVTPARRWGRYDDYGCRVNAWSVERLFERYAQSRFLYPAKMSRLAPHLPEVMNNWRLALRAGELIHWVASYEDPEGGGWASISSWRSTGTGWQTQHLVSTGGPVASRAVMLAGQSVRIADGFDSSHQDWFRRSNPFAASVFGTFTDRVGADRAALIDYQLLSVPLSLHLSEPADAALGCPVGAEARAALTGLVRQVRGAVFTAAEELDGDDLELDEVDRLYRLVGLRRYRRIRLVEDGDGVVGAVLCYRGPLGFNFSFLENRCDLVLRPGLSTAARAAAICGLMAAAQAVYADISIGYIPVVTDQATAAALVELGAESIRSYSQSIWLRSAFEDWYDHVDGLYAQRLGGRDAR